MGAGAGAQATDGAAKPGAGRAGAGGMRRSGLPPPRIAPAEGLGQRAGLGQCNAGRAAHGSRPRKERCRRARIAPAEGALPPRTERATRSSTAASPPPPPPLLPSSPPPSPSPPPSTVSSAVAVRPANRAFARVGFRARHVHALPPGLRKMACARAAPRRVGKVSGSASRASLMPPCPTGRARPGIPGRRPAPRGKPCDAARWGAAASVQPSGRPAQDRSRQ